MGAILGMLVPDAYVEIWRMWVLETAEFVTKLSKLSATRFVSNIRHQHQYNC